MKVLMILYVAILSTAAFSHMNLGQANSQLELRNEYIPPLSEQDQRWRDYNPTAHTPAPPAPPKVEWDKMPAGTRCGNYVMSGNTVRALDLCMGHNPRNSCPSGFVRRNFGYFEAGGGDRYYMWCTKT